MAGKNKGKQGKYKGKQREVAVTNQAPAPPDVAPLYEAKQGQFKGEQIEVAVRNLAPAPPEVTPLEINVQSKMSQSLPFVKRPVLLDGSMAGDVGFDPFGLANNKDSLNFNREAEIKHGRLAMLAAAGWPVSELLDKKIAVIFGLPTVLDVNNRVPSVLNGGMGKISPFYWGAIVVFAAAVDVYSLSQVSKKEGYFPGNLGFDPFGLYPKDDKGQKRMRTAEIKHMRLAMIAITAFAAQEFVTHLAVVDQTPFFFKPIWQVLTEHVSEPFPPMDTPTIFEAVTAPVDAAVATSAEAATAVTSPLDAAVTTVIEAIKAVTPPVDDAVTTTIEAVKSVTPPVDDVSAASVKAASNVSPSLDNEELLSAKKRIAELELKLAEISNLIR